MAQLSQLLQPLAPLQQSVAENAQAIANLQTNMQSLQAATLTIEQVQEVANKTFAHAIWKLESGVNRSMENKNLNIRL